MGPGQKLEVEQGVRRLVDIFIRVDRMEKLPIAINALLANDDCILASALGELNFSQFEEVDDERVREIVREELDEFKRRTTSSLVERLNELTSQTLISTPTVESGTENGMNEQRAKEIVQSLTGLTYKEWQAIEQQVNQEFRRLANLNTLHRTENIVKNIILEVGNG